MAPLLLALALSNPPAPLPAPTVAVGIPEAWKGEGVSRPQATGPLHLEKTRAALRGSGAPPVEVAVPVLRPSPWWYPLAELGLRVLEARTSR